MLTETVILTIYFEVSDSNSRNPLVRVAKKRVCTLPAINFGILSFFSKVGYFG